MLSGAPPLPPPHRAGQREQPQHIGVKEVNEEPEESINDELLIAGVSMHGLYQHIKRMTLHTRPLR